MSVYNELQSAPIIHHVNLPITNYTVRVKYNSFNALVCY